MSVTATKQATGSRPTDPGQRIQSVDIVRGFALFGVLLVNMFNFGATFPVWTDLPDELALAVMQIFFETKSFRLFSFLFGFGIALQLAKSGDAGNINFLFYARRMAVLFVLGMANCLLYDGDVLMLYAEFGIILLLFRKAPLRLLLLGWLALNLVFPVQRAIHSFKDHPSEMISEEERIRQSQSLMEELKKSHPYNVGTILEVMEHNARAIPPNPLNETSFLGMCLLGMYVARQRIFKEAGRHRKLIKKVLLWGISLGLLGMLIDQWLKFSVGYSMEDTNQASVFQQLIGDLFLVFGSTALALSYAAGLILLSQSARFNRVVAPLAAVGRFALTTYLFQSLMFSILFYGFGFGLGLYTGPFMVLLYAMLFFTIQVLICNWWAHYFRFGPVEWVWRSVSYWKWVPIRIQVQLSSNTITNEHNY